MPKNKYKLDNPIDMLGYAVGYMGMSVRDFLGLSSLDSYSLNYDEFKSIYKWHEKKMQDQHRSSALICSLLANIHRDKKKKNSPYTYEDFMLRPKEKKDPKTLHTMFKALFKVKK